MCRFVTCCRRIGGRVIRKRLETGLESKRLLYSYVNKKKNVYKTRFILSDLLSLVISLTLTHTHSLLLTRSLTSRQAFDAAGHTRACKETKKRHLQTHGARGFPPVCRRTCYTTRGCCCCLHRWTAINRRK